MARPKANDTQWAENQRALARALGLSIEEWNAQLEAAGARSTGIYAAVVGAAMAKGLGLGILDGLDGPALAARAQKLLDPKPPRVKNPILAEAIRRAEEGALEGTGHERLRTRTPVPTPRRETKSLGESAQEGAPDAPGARRRESSTRHRRPPKEED